MIRLAPLTRSEAAEYLARKLSAAGRSEATFTPRAITRLHLLSQGVPRGLDRLATLALMAGAMRGLEVIGPEVVEGVAAECVLPESCIHDFVLVPVASSVQETGNDDCDGTPDMQE